MKYLPEWTMCSKMNSKEKRLITNRNQLHKRKKYDRIDLAYFVYCIQNTGKQKENCNVYNIKWRKRIENKQAI